MSVELLIEPKQRDLGGFSVARLLPHAARRSVGPFVFLDHLGPTVFAPGRAVDVRPHPHIGLSTLTFCSRARSSTTTTSATTSRSGPAR